MAKRISCRVVNSVPLGKNSGPLPHTGSSNEKYREAGGETVALNFCPGRRGNSTTCTDWFGPAGVSFGDCQMGQILDFYV